MALGGAARILIVEDEFLFAMDLQSRLNDLGYKNIYHAENIFRAFELLDAVSPDFAILDVNIGRDLVFPVATKLASGNVPFVFATGLSRETLPVEWQDRPVLGKPLTQLALEAALLRLSLWNAAVATPVAPAASAEGQCPADESVSAPTLFEHDSGASLLASPLPKEQDAQAAGEEALRPACEPDPRANTADPSGGQVIASKPPSSA